jgi:hypothetical protein
MQVSNSTGRNTDYRVGASGGNGANCSGGAYMNSTASGSTAPAAFASGRLAPGATEIYASSGACTVEFTVGGLVVASASYPQDPGQVALVEEDGRFKIQTAASDGYAAA